jgi:Flp pilus assembly protein TadG
MRRLTAANFESSQQGSVAIIFALLTTVLFGMIALAIDGARAYAGRARVAHALDAAALAGAKAMDNGKSDAEVESIAQAFFLQAMEQAGNPIAVSNFRITLDRWNDVVDVATDAKLNTIFASVIGQREVSLDRSSRVKYKTRRVELAMALDVTGSMEGAKIAEMKLAAKEVLQTMFGEAASDDAVRISLVPWASAVNVGTRAGVVSANQSVDNCVIERVSGQAATDAAPYGVDASRAFSTAPYGYTCPTAPLVPLSGRQQESTLRASIENLSTAGGTAGHLGLAWGWYTLAPTWTGIWPTASQPRIYAPSETIKAILLMSDGEFNISWKSLSEYSTANAPTMMTESYEQFRALCTEIKAKKVIIYTVGFGLDPAVNQMAIDELKACATGDAQFYNATTGNDLKMAFKEIAVQLKSMRITQ